MNTINLFTFKPHKKTMGGNCWNFGEYLSRKILQKMGYHVNHFHNGNYPKNDINDLVVGIGGILHYKALKRAMIDRVKHIHIWGTGFGSERNMYRWLIRGEDINKFSFNMVRGVLTRDCYKLPKDVLLGDHGFLTSLLYPNASKQGNNKIVYVKHLLDYRDDETILKKYDDIDEIIETNMPEPDFDKHFFDILNKISSAKLVITNSMHGAIVAHSYGVPWCISPRHKRRSTVEQDISKEAKWFDSFSSCGLDAADLKICHNSKDGFRWWDKISKKIRPIDKEYRERILDSFPKI